MNWKEFKEEVEKQGVKDETEIRRIHIYSGHYDMSDKIVGRLERGTYFNDVAYIP